MYYGQIVREILEARRESVRLFQAKDYLLSAINQDVEIDKMEVINRGYYNAIRVPSPYDGGEPYIFAPEQGLTAP